MNTHDLKVGDVVAIRGDRRRAGKYLPEQLVDGKYVKRHGTDEIWTGRIDAITPGDEGDMVKVGGGWRGCEMYEKV